MNVQTYLSALLVALLALAACNDPSLAPQPEDLSSLGKEKFTRCKPHVNAPAGPPDLVVVAPSQPVMLYVGDDQHTPGRFRSRLEVHEGGAACGQARLELGEADSEHRTGIIVIVVGFTGAAVSEEEGRTTVRFRGVAEVCSGRGECRSEAMTGEVGQQPFDDDPIWQFHAGDVYSFPAQTSFIAPGHNHRAAHGSPEQEAPQLRLAVAPPPEPISEREVQEELARVGPEHRHAVPDFQRLLKLFAAARTHAAYQYLSAEALRVALERPGRASDAFLRRLVRAQTGARLAPGLATPTKPQAACLVDFDNPLILGSLPNQAQDTFALSPFYTQPCGDGSGLIRVEPMQYGHYHLVYENPEIACIDLNTGLYGYGQPGDPNCQPLEDPSAEPRYLGAHHASQVIKIWRSTGFILVPLTFSMDSFVNRGGEPVKLRFRTQDGQWNQFSSLGGYTRWDVSAWVKDVVEIQITHVSTDPDCGSDWLVSGPGGGCPPGGGPFFLDEFAINP